MFKLETKDNGERLAVKPKGLCFYCGNFIADGHGATCVVPQRAVVVRRTMQFVISVPQHWTADDIEFHRNLGSSCADNDLRHLVEIDGPCTCGNSQTQFLREATEEDVSSMPRTFEYPDAD